MQRVSCRLKLALPGISSMQRLGLTFLFFLFFKWWSILCLKKNPIWAEYKSLRKSPIAKLYQDFSCYPQFLMYSNLAELSLRATMRDMPLELPLDQAWWWSSATALLLLESMGDWTYSVGEGIENKLLAKIWFEASDNSLTSVLLAKRKREDEEHTQKSTCWGFF